MNSKAPKNPASQAPVSSIGISDFVGGITHEIANIFNTITINVEMAKYLIEGGQTQRSAEVLDRLVSECNRCNRLVQGMQRFGSGLRSQEAASVSVREQVDASVLLAREEARGEHPEVKVNHEDASLKILADAPALRRAMAGLVQNAREAGAKTIHIDIRRDGADAVIDFRDDGPGIPPDILPRVTDPFFSTHRGDGCCGLGLTLMADLARRHDGSLSIAANEPQGAWLSLRMPALAAAEHAAR